MAGRWREGREHDGVSRTSSRDPKKSEPKLDLAFEFERTWGSEKMKLTIQEMLAEQTRQLQACVAREVQKVQRLLAEHTQQLTRCVAKEAQKQARALQDSVAARAPGGLEELLEQEMEERRTGQAGLREMIDQHGGALARIEALFRPPSGVPLGGNPSTASETASSVPSGGTGAGTGRGESAAASTTSR